MWHFPSKLTVTVTESAGPTVPLQLGAMRSPSPTSNYVSVISLPWLSAIAQIQYHKNNESQTATVPKGTFSYVWVIHFHLPNRDTPLFRIMHFSTRHCGRQTHKHTNTHTQFVVTDWHIVHTPDSEWWEFITTVETKCPQGRKTSWGFLWTLRPSRQREENTALRRPSMYKLDCYFKSAVFTLHTGTGIH